MAKGQRAMAPGETVWGYPPVPRSEALPYPLRDSLRRWRSLVGMMIGVGIALGIGMVMMAVSAASVNLFTSDYRKSGADLYVVTQGGKLIALLPSDSPGSIRHARGALAQVRGIAEVQAAIGFITWSMERQREGPARHDEPADLIAVVGIDGDPAAVPGALAMDAGRWLRRSNEIVLGSKLARETGLGIGDSIRLNGFDFNVVGIGRFRGGGYSGDSMAYLDRQALRQRTDLGDVISVIIVETDRPSSVRPRLQEIGDFSISDPAELVKQAEEANASGIAIRLILVVLTLAIAALFVSNMLLRSVSERRIEFATLRAIGIPSRTILFTVAAQAVMISAAAGVFGIGISTALGTLINRLVAAQFGIESLYAPDATMFGLIFVLALGLGLASGLHPARQATRVDPALVLREA